MFYEWFKYTDYEEQDYYDGPLSMTFKINDDFYYATLVSDTTKEWRYFSVKTTQAEVDLYHSRLLNKEYDLAHFEMLYREGRYCTFDWRRECVKMEDLRLPVKGDVLNEV